MDKYESDYTVFNILGIEVWVEDDQLSEALKTLTEKKRNIILLSYFMDMSDSEISEFIKIPRSNVQYHRTKTLEAMRKHGNVCMVVDADLKNRVQTALLDMLMNFEIVVM